MINIKDSMKIFCKQLRLNGIEVDAEQFRVLKYSKNDNDPYAKKLVQNLLNKFAKSENRYDN